MNLLEPFLQSRDLGLLAAPALIGFSCKNRFLLRKLPAQLEILGAQAAGLPPMDCAKSNASKNDQDENNLPLHTGR